MPATDPRPFEFHGHRGARGLAPENTLAAVERALALGVTAIEVDVALTADGVVVVHHDPRLHPDHTRDASGAWLAGPGPAIVEVDHEALLAFDVGRLRPGSDDARRFPHQVPADGSRIPTLEAVIDCIERRAGDAVRFNIELKRDPGCPSCSASPDALADAVMQLITRRKIATRTMVQSFDWSVVAAVRALAPELETACLTSVAGKPDTVAGREDGPSPWTGLRLEDHGGSVPAMVAAFGAPVWNPGHRDLDARALADAHALGLKVLTWTVNEEAEMARLIAMGVDGITTDYPDRLVATARACGLPPPHTF